MAFSTTIRLCDSFDFPADGDASKGTPSGNVVVVTLQRGDAYPKTIEEVEALVESGRVAPADLTKARTIINAQRGR